MRIWKRERTHCWPESETRSYLGLLRFPYKIAHTCMLQQQRSVSPQPWGLVRGPRHRCGQFWVCKQRDTFSHEFTRLFPHVYRQSNRQTGTLLQRAPISSNSHDFITTWLPHKGSNPKHRQHESCSVNTYFGRQGSSVLPSNDFLNE